MILALAFFLDGTLNPIDYREFIRTNSLSHEHLVAAKHFLQRDYIFTEEIETELMKWYSEFANHVMHTVQPGYYFDIIRHDHVFASIENNSSWESGARYLEFMREVVLPRIEDFQQDIRREIR